MIAFRHLAGFVCALTCSIPAAAQRADGIEEVAGGSFEQFNIYAIRVDAFGPGDDGNYQAVLTLRNGSPKRQGLAASHLELYLIDADGESIRNFGNLYNVRSKGGFAALERHDQTLWVERDAEVKVRIFFPQSAGFAPSKLRVRENVATPATVTFAIE